MLNDLVVMMICRPCASGRAVDDDRSGERTATGSAVGTVASQTPQNESAS